jgi:D-alanyl-D-alanine carboxypeptidase
MLNAGLALSHGPFSLFASQLSPESLADALNGLQMTLPQEKFKLFKSFLPLAGKSGSLINR